MRRRARTDLTHAPIVKALRDAGCLVQSLASLGHGVPDLLVANWHGDLFLLEVKSDDEDLTPDQVAWHARWVRLSTVGPSGALAIVHNEREALDAVGVPLAGDDHE